MIINIKDLKNKIIYRANYRGTKEMDKLLGSFVRKYIDLLDKEELLHLCNLLDCDDENLYKLNQGLQVTIQIENNKIIELFKKYDYANEQWRRD